MSQNMTPWIILTALAMTIGAAVLGSGAGRERVEARRSLQQRIAAVDIDEAEARAFYSAHCSAFGRRSFEESRLTVERLLALEQID
ncbi:MAG: hypothetical protein M3495_10270 [Pseudomonadota bacterium]|nr:hypothetical protein [Gammaproteobacteria bacterium]MDQ3581958.1 hypothetical protein [Pseudomonadota bacterium]